MTGNAIAVVGVSCRLPQAPNAEAFWRLLSEGRSGITEVPEGRWDTAGLVDAARHGGFLDQVAGFDAGFFGISPREATAMDPQQRLVLELAWEALENARMRPADLAGSKTGIYVGAIARDYAAVQHRQGAESITSHSFTGLQQGLIANRVSYAFGLRGPSLTVDAAQASSLVAVHLASEALRRGDTTLALAGGVHLMLAPESAITLTKFGALSPDGRCYTFDARADGFVRGEGGAVVVLKRLADAVADGDRVHCVILGSTVNNDGATDGLTVPSAEAQRELIEDAYAQAGVAVDDVQYVELHGTGTPVGDPIEAAALGAALGEHRTNPLLVGSVKTNVGHLEGAAGIVGLLKLALSIRSRELPASLNFETPNPQIPLDELGLRVHDTHGPWPRPDAPLLAGVSSFGIGGTNCHVVVSSHPEPAEEPRPDTEIALPFVVSAHDRDALRAQAEQLSEIDTSNIADIGLSLTKRSLFEHRAVVVASNREELTAGLGSLARNLPAANVVEGRAADQGKVVFVFPGQGSQWQGMAADLLESNAVFRDKFHECASELERYLDWSVVDALREAPDLERTDVVQPMLFAVMVSLSEVWRSVGVQPDAVVGHSQGEVAAAYVAGALSLADAAKIIVRRSQIVHELSGPGGLASARLPTTEVQARLTPWGEQLSVAAVNSPLSTVIAGSAEAIDELMAKAHNEGFELRRIPVRYASHSVHVEPLREPLREALADVTGKTADVAFYSTVSGTVLDGTELNGDYWYRNLRETVEFERATRALAEAGHGVFIEVSPHPVLAMSVPETLENAVVVGSLRRNEPSWPRLLDGMARVFTAGVDVDWSASFASARVIDLPSYPFQRKRYWLGDAPATEPTADSTPEPDDLVRAHVAAVLGHQAPDEIDMSKSFKALGFDSLTAVELRNRLATAAGTYLPAGVLYDYPTPAELTEHLREHKPEIRRAPTVVHGEEPIAIVATSCRYPGGVRSAEDLWQLLADEVDAIAEPPADRGWQQTPWYDPTGRKPGTSYAKNGGFLDRIDQFDADFFGISPREALAMDPQQRLLLELTWEALERAGIVPGTLSGSDTGVFVGVMASDYGPRIDNVADELGGYRLTGTSVSVASGRLAYTLGLQGPALTVDTACSSSLVAVHMACRSLRQGDCSLALAGGAAVMATPGLLIEFSRQRGLSEDGRCKAFGAGADGTGWAEGAGLVVLERLSDAQRHGHPILALVRGSAINQDGASNGLTAPRGPAQEAVIRLALADAGLSAADVDLIEGHGTGTKLGDPIEAEALLATYGQDRDQPVRLGSLKSNIGHTQAAAGVGGLIKLVAALRHETMPATLHAETPSPHVDWSRGALSLLTEPVPWPRTERPRRAAISSFGISGTNGHLIVEEPPASEPTARPADISSVRPYVLSAKTPSALPAQAQRLAAHLRTNPSLALAEVGRALGTTRTHHRHRAAIVAADRDELLRGLDELVAGESVRTGRVVFVFPGQGSQWQGMAGELLDTSPVARDHLKACAGVLDPLTGWSLLDLLRNQPGAAPLERADVVQPALFAVMTALAELWRAYGVRPDAVVGHSQGEIAAAYVAGALSLEDAAKVVALRSRALAAIGGRGGMVSVPVSPAEVETMLAPWHGRIGIAAVNGPLSTVVSGDADALAELLAQFERARRIPVDYASHSAHVEAIRDDVYRVLTGITPRSSEIPFYSTLFGDVIDTADLGPEYWYRNLRERVRYDEATRLLLDHGHRIFVEVSPHPVLTIGTQETIDEGDTDAVAFGTLRRDDGGEARMASAVSQAYVHGVEPDWEALFGAGKPAPLPTYAFQGESYWLAPTEGSRQADVTGAGLAAAEHPLLGATVELPDGQVLHTGRLSVAAHPWLGDHAVLDTIVVPGAALVELAAHVGRCAGLPQVAELTLHAPMVLAEQGALQLQVQVADEAITIHSRQDGSPWTLNASGALKKSEPGSEKLGGWPLAEEVDLTAAYAELADRGYRYGPRFQGLRGMWRDGETLYAEVENPGDDTGFLIHPAALDAALHPLLLGKQGPMQLPFSWSSVEFVRPCNGVLRIRLQPAEHGAMSVTIFDEDTEHVATIGALTLRPYAGDQSMYSVDWVPLTEQEHRADADEVVVVPLAIEDSADQVARVHAATYRALKTIQEHNDSARLVLLTRSAVATHSGEHVGDLAAAAVWGLIRSAQAENPDRLTVIDVDGDDESAALQRAIRSGEPQAAIRDGEVLVPRLVRTPAPLRLPDGDGWQVDIASRGTIDGISVVDKPNRPLAAGEVRIAVRAAGVNFHDLVLALDMVDDPGGIGLEGAGVVVEVAPDVTEPAVGDRVMGLFTGAFAPLAVVDHRMVARIPDGWSFAEAASVPAAFLTAWFGLADLGKLRAGERVLIHAATGGVGTAAVQLAQHWGAEVFGTASPGKWPALRALGVTHIASSRDDTFEKQFTDATAGDGVHVVLNSLSGDLVDASLRLLRPGGRFVEMGKTDIRDLAIGYQAFDLLTDVKPDRIAEIFADLLPLFEQGVLRPLPVTCFDVRRAGDAYRHLAKARHIGKIVLTIPRQLKPTGTVLVTGATGTLGAEIARRLVVRHGVRHLLLVSRTGPDAPEANELVADLRQLGAEAKVLACDVADSVALQRVLDAAEHPLTAVVHAAGVLDDGVIASLTPERIDTVMRPKVDAAWNLHNLTKKSDLDAFVLFSSVAGTIGTAGQAGYAAANAFLDALAHHRRVTGDSAVSLAWGLWQQDSGMTGHMTDTDRTRLSRSGVAALDMAEGLSLFDAGLDLDQATAVPVRLDMAALAQLGQAAPAVLRGMVTAKAPRTASTTGSSALREQLTGLSDKERQRVLVELVRTHSAAVLGRASSAAVDATLAFKEQGFDSLTAVELRNRLDKATGHRLPPTLVFDFPNPIALARHLAAELVPQAAPRQPEVVPAAQGLLATATPDELFAFIDQELGVD